MKKSNPFLSLARICSLFGVTRQAYYQYSWRQIDITTEQEIVLQLVRQVRNDQPMIGTRKLYVLLKPILMDHQIKMGRDALFDLLAAHGLLVRRRKRTVRTTQSSHWMRKYPNLIRTMIVNKPDQLWVSDITYVKTVSGFLYISFITDAYSRKIAGYHLANSLDAVNSLKALDMALQSLPREVRGLTHHSDRGLQYCSGKYVKRLQDNNIAISMTDNGDPLENAIAERINGIIKHEFLYNQPLLNREHATEQLDKAVWVYNNQRPHMSCNMLTPIQAHQNSGQMKRLWKNYYSKPDNVNTK